ncbi:PfkB family carbohydrate kinase [Actinoplanes sp. NPDC051861]|uniref:PfkB family carbohydrate kinase n=1 Tax=Actinoplanes sp. NPDC051861 TaxID=3155170 RepID=UPI003436986B
MRVLCVGLATVDLVQRVDRFPAADEKIQSTSASVAAGGPATNAAVTAAALGASVTLLTVVGSHPLGALIHADLTARGVTVIDAAPDLTDPPPVSAVTVLSSSGTRTIVSRNAGTHSADLPPGGIPEADLTLVDGHHPVLAVAAARSASRLVVDAGSWRPVFTEVFPHAEVVACSADFRHPSAPSPSVLSPSAPLALDEATAAAVGARKVVVTHGPDPVRWFDAGGAGFRAGTAGVWGEITVPPVPATDTAGAGDVFHGALCVALAQEADLQAAISYAIRIAGIRVQHPGPRDWLAHL